MLWLWAAALHPAAACSCNPCSPDRIREAREDHEREVVHQLMKAAVVARARVEELSPPWVKPCVPPAGGLVCVPAELHEDARLTLLSEPQAAALHLRRTWPWGSSCRCGCRHSTAPPFRPGDELLVWQDRKGGWGWAPWTPECAEVWLQGERRQRAERCAQSMSGATAIWTEAPAGAPFGAPPAEVR